MEPNRLIKSGSPNSLSRYLCPYLLRFWRMQRTMLKYRSCVSVCGYHLQMVSHSPVAFQRSIVSNKVIPLLIFKMGHKGTAKVRKFDYNQADQCILGKINLLDICRHQKRCYYLKIIWYVDLLIFSIFSLYYFRICAKSSNFVAFLNIRTTGLNRKTLTKKHNTL